MLRYIIFFFLFLAYQPILQAQPGFNRYYELDYNGSFFFNGIYENDTLYLLTSVSNLSNHGVALVKADTNGNILDIHPFFPADNNSITFGNNYDIKITPDGDLVFLGNRGSGIPMVLMRFKRDGTVTSVIDIPFPNDYDIINPELELYKDGFLIGGAVRDYPEYWARAFIMHVDTAGNVRWMHRFGYTDHSITENSRCFRIVDDNTILVGSVIGNGLVAEPWGISRIISVDSLGAIRWDWRSTPQDESIISDIQPLPDGGLLFVHKKLEIINNQITGAWSEVVRLDSARQIRWTKRISPTNWVSNQSNDLIATPDGHWIVSDHVAFGSYLISPAANNQCGCLTKITNDGDILWQTCDSIPWPVAEPTDSDDIPSAHVVLPSGSSILIGGGNFYVPGPVRSYGWLMKVDANGCLQAPCTVGNSAPIATPQPAIQLFPNPASAYLYVFMPADNGPGLLQLFYATGALAREENFSATGSLFALDITQLPTGIYWARFTRQDGASVTEKVVIQR